MTREEAIRHLHTFSTTMGSGQTSDEQHKEAKRMAIEALKDRDGMIRAILDVLDSDDFPEDKCHRIELMLRGEVK